MADSEAWLALVETYCSLAKEAAHAESKEKLLAALHAEGGASLTLVQLIFLMEAQLTSTDSTVRARAVLLLSEASVLRSAASLPLAQASFCSCSPAPPSCHSTRATCRTSSPPSWATGACENGKLQISPHSLRRSSLLGALTGALHLLRACPLDEEVVHGLATSLLAEVHVPSLAPSERLLALQCLSELPLRHAAVALRCGQKLLEGAIAAVDGEKEPRCLAQAFQLWTQLGAAFPADGAPMAACAEEMLDSVACYFPLTLSGRRSGSQAAPDRGALAASLSFAMTSSAAFAPFALPLVLGKLAVPEQHGESGVLDSLHALSLAAAAFPAAALQPHAEAAWRALRGLILPAPPAESGAGAHSGTVRRAACGSLTLLARSLAARPGGSGSGSGSGSGRRRR